MKTVVYYNNDGKITSCYSTPDGVTILEKGNSLELQGFVDVGESFVSDGVLTKLPPQPSLNHTFDYASKAWLDLRTLDDLKAAKWEQIKGERSAAEYGGFTWDGAVFDSDAISQNRINGAVTLAMLDSAFTTDWTLANNTVRTLGADDMIQVGAALGAHVNTQFVIGQAVRVQIYAAASIEAVEMVGWPT